MSQKNFASYGDMETLVTEIASNRPTSFVGTRSEWNALPVATQVKYSLVNLIGEGVYKNNGTGLDNIADAGGGSSLEAGNYIEIDANDKINVKLQKGDYTEYEYRFTGAYSPNVQLTIEKYRDGVLVSTENYENVSVYTPITIDGLFDIWYGGDGYYWHYKLLEDSQEHSAGYEDSWYYTDMVTRTETFDVDDEAATLVTKGDLGTASAKNVPASGDAGNNEVVLGSDSRLTDSRPASDVPSWAKQSTKPTYTASEVGAIATTQKGVASGVAELDSNGKVPSSQLPSYVDDVIEGYYDTITDRFYTESTFENVIPPESGKSWVDVASNKSYRWTGSVYSRVDEGVQLGETSDSAYRGDRGKTAYDHSQTTGNPHSTTKGDVGLGNVPNVSTNDQEPTFTEAGTRNNIASGEKLSVIFGKVQKFFNDLKTVAFSGSFSDLSNKPENANTFQGTIAEWNQLTTAEKKAYDHASIPDSLDGNVTFPASKVMMLDGASVEADLASAVPRTATGTAMASLVSAIGQLSEAQKVRCKIVVNNNFVLTASYVNSGAVRNFNLILTSGTTTLFNEYDLNVASSTFKKWTQGQSAATEISVTAWTLYYSGTPIS